jgi:AcrR family transcriptional regulator
LQSLSFPVLLFDTSSFRPFFPVRIVLFVSVSACSGHNRLEKLQKTENFFGSVSFLVIFVSNKTTEDMTPPQKERIIDQAMQMFATQGIKSVRMDDIAQHLGVSKRTLYELFGDKEGLLYLAMERYFQRDRQRWTELTANARNVLEAMFMVLAQVMDKAEVSSRMMDNLKKFYPAVHDKLTREGMEKNRRSLRGMLDQGIVDGLFVDNINIDLAISVLYYTASALVTRKELMLPAGMTEREAFVQIISNFFRGISTAKGLRMIDDNLKRYELTKYGK